MEKCWDIEEVRPIKATVTKSGSGLHIAIPPMSMTYETYKYLDHNHLHSEPDYPKRPDDTMAVFYGCYDYEDGTCEFYADSQADLDKWLNYPKYKGIVCI